MRRSGNYSKSLMLLALPMLLVGHDAHAYIDPNSAGLLYQVFFPVIVAVTLAWRWVKDLCLRVWSKVTREFWSKVTRRSG